MRVGTGENTKTSTENREIPRGVGIAERRDGSYKAEGRAGRSLGIKGVAKLQANAHQSLHAHRNPHSSTEAKGHKRQCTHAPGQYVSPAPASRTAHLWCKGPGCFFENN